jgi:hypothetical protein
VDDRADEIWLALWREVHEHVTAEKFMIGMSIAHHGRQWVETGNPYHVDFAVAICADAGIEQLPTLVSLVEEVAKKRLHGEVRAGTPNQIRKAAAKDFALNLMTILCAAGASREVAASKAARQLAERSPAARYKASALAKFYLSQTWQEREQRRREYFATDEGAPSVSEWRRILPMLPDADEDLTGVLR